jgi:hypothetical protein
MNVGNVRAEKVEVFVRRAFMEKKELPQFTPMNLRWSNGDFQKPTIYTDGISPQMGRYCDFAAISDPAHPELKGTETRLQLQFQLLQPTTEWLQPGKYTFDISLAASNCDPVTWVVELHLTGLWSDNEKTMLANGFVVKVLEE